MKNPLKTETLNLLLRCYIRYELDELLNSDGVFVKSLELYNLRDVMRILDLFKHKDAKSLKGDLENLLTSFNPDDPYWKVQLFCLIV